MVLARIHHQMENPDKAIEVLEIFIRKHPLETDPTHVNILAELYIDSKQYRKAVQLIERVADQICKEGLPIDLQVASNLSDDIFESKVMQSINMSSTVWRLPGVCRHVEDKWSHLKLQNLHQSMYREVCLR